ncbi:cysteine-rich RLK (RECEPTOR-like protein kinase) 14 [Hibiscus trionum]|uniref:Cysteine-rich RLK (RECEPTOR-like protein kinase) 14 n=1 Tax=Hibiscus trionum TaxID=183268 RepID=A0A9W7JEN5_HIBTR|nr:cysteine-rich RLK (RECEPTOR-like protein kinase) 14 [Hibiscus trionum]
MDAKKLVLVCCLIVLGIRLTFAQTCLETGNFTTNSGFGRNRDRILTSLPTNVSQNGGFFNASIGQGLDKVYAQALCRGDLSEQDCFIYVNFTAHQLISSCTNQKEAFSWDGDIPCLVRYSNASFFGVLALEPIQEQINPDDISDATSNVTQFFQIWGELMEAVATKASMGSSRLKYATGVAEEIQALMQCTPDLSQSDCSICLRTLVRRYTACCRTYQGGYVETPSCRMRWDLYTFFKPTADTVHLSLSSPPSASPPESTNKTSETIKDNKAGISSGTIAIIVVSIIVFVAIVAFICIRLRKRKNSKQEMNNKEDGLESLESLQFQLKSVRKATDNFSQDNMLGQGGFGAVYKGRLDDGQEIAVKRLFQGSGQGGEEFKNEVMVMARLQHRNLVRLKGFCLERKERLLIFEFVPNSSLDHILFDPIKRPLLDWDTRYKIITGIARGLLYLHEDSQYRIVHRDLKAPNILLDEEMTPKISDFGMARLFGADQTRDNTRRVAGTFGYMAPEYIRQGKYSVKSDVYSFGVLILEIISGDKISHFRNNGADLLTYAWRNWREGTCLNLVDEHLRGGSGSRSEMTRSIHIGLLCVQESDANRPSMNSVVLMLIDASVSMPMPSTPAFMASATTVLSEASSSSDYNNSDQFTRNKVSISTLDPR